MATDIARREELRAVSLAFHLPIHHGGSRVRAGTPEGVPAVSEGGSGACHKTHSGRLRLFPRCSRITVSLGLWKRSWDEAAKPYDDKDPDRLTDRPSFGALGGPGYRSWTEELRALPTYWPHDPEKSGSAF